MTTTRLRFCLCSTFYPPYGSDPDAAYIEALASGLARLGHEVTVVHNPDAWEVLRGERTAEPYATRAGLTVKPVRASSKRGSLLAVHQTGRAWGQRKILLECFDQPYDVIHYHNVSLLGGPEIYSLGESRLKIASLNDHWLVCPMHLLWKYTGEACEEPQCIRCSLAHRKPPQLWRYTPLLESMARQVDVFLGPSRFTMRKHRERGFDRPMTHLPALCAVPAREGAERAGPPVARPYFLATGRLEPYKGFQEIIPVFRDFPEYALVICGRGSCEAELRALAGGMTNVHFAGAVSRQRLQACYEHAVATIVPTLAYQTFCHSTAESFSAGTPVIARRIGPAEEIIAEHGGGILYSEPGELRQAITALAGNESKRSGLGREALAVHAREFSEETYLRRYLGLVEELHGRKSTGVAS